MNDPWCSGLLKGDPDIAGTGVVAAIWITNLTAVVAGGLLWCFTIIMKKSPRDKPYKRVLLCAFALGDTAFITMLAIIWSSIILIKSEPDTSLYHVFIARCLAQNCQTGLFSSVPYYDYRTSGYRGTVGAVTRVVLYAAALILWFYWTGLCINEFSKWRPITPSCFYNDTWMPGSYIGWMRLDLVWTPCAWLWYYLEAWGKCEDFLRMTNDFVPNLPNRIKTIRQRYSRKVQSLSTNRKSSIAFVFRFGAFCILIIYVLVDIVGCLLVAIFVAPPTTAPWANLFIFIWSMYDVLAVWRSNRHIVVECPPKFSLSLQGNKNPESDWGFGQLLPMFLLLLPILTVVDSFD